MHLLGVSSEPGVRPGSERVYEFVLKTEPAEILIPLLQVTKNCHVSSVQEFL